MTGTETANISPIQIMDQQGIIHEFDLAVVWGTGPDIEVDYVSNGKQHKAWFFGIQWMKGGNYFDGNTPV